jgi:hypothetical protein
VARAVTQAEVLREEYASSFIVSQCIWCGPNAREDTAVREATQAACLSGAPGAWRRHRARLTRRAGMGGWGRATGRTTAAR